MKTKFKLMWLMLLIVTASKPSFSQQILWEKSFNWFSDESFYCITNSSNGGFICGGSTYKYGANIVNIGSFVGSVLVNFDGNGDTLWHKNLRQLGYVKGLHPVSGGLLWAVVQRSRPDGFSPFFANYYPSLFLISNDSSIVLNIEYPQLDYFNIGDSYPTVDGGLILFGSKSPSTITGYEMDFYAVKFGSLGQIEWSRAYNPGPTNSFCQGGHVEPMSNGRFLVSGSAGKKIVSFEIDQESGNDTNYVEWYQTPSNHIFDAPAVVQAPTFTRRISGYKRSNPQQFYFGNKTDLNQSIWGGEKLGGCLPPIINDDGSSIFYYSSNQIAHLSRINFDSTQVWDINLITSSQITGKKLLRDLYYNSDGQGVMVGSNYSGIPNSGNDFYIAKFSNVGQPFDPTGIKYPYLVKTDAVPFPNPATIFFQFKKDYQNGEVFLYSLTGKMLKSQNITNKERIDVSSLAKGTYLYRAVLDGKPHWGRILKE